MANSTSLTYAATVAPPYSLVASPVQDTIPTRAAKKEKKMKSISPISGLSQRKGEFFFTWGYNRATYTRSDIHFSGQGYNFTLYDVKALDFPSKFKANTYFRPATITVPQFNFRLGYFINNKYSLSVGWDHMKYVMVRNRQVTINGHIAADVSNPSISTGAYQGVYDHATILVAPDFLTFEHTDGLNYASLELDRLDNVWTAKNGKTGLSVTGGLGIGAVVPRSDVRLFTIGRNNFWNVAGFGASVKGGVKLDILKNLFVEAFVKAGYIDLLHIRTTGRPSDRAKQQIGFVEGAGLIGYKIQPFRKKLRL